MELFIFLLILLLFIAAFGIAALVGDNLKLRREVRVKDFCINVLREDIDDKGRLINFYKNEKEISKDV